MSRKKAAIYTNFAAQIKKPDYMNFGLIKPMSLIR